MNSLIIARSIGPSAYGVFSIFYAAMVIFWQLPQAFDGYFIASARKVDSQSGKTQLLKACVQLKLAYVLMGGALAYPVAMTVAHLVEKPAVLFPILTAFACGAGLAFLSSIASTYQEAERFGRYASANAFYTGPVLLGLATLFLVNGGITLWGSIGVYVVVCTLVGALSFCSIRKRTGRMRSVDFRLVSDSFHQGKWLLLALMASVIFGRMDLLFLTRYADFESIGVYSVAAQLILFVDLAVGALSGICLPKAGKAVRSDSLLRIFFKENLVMIGVLLCGIAVMVLIAPILVDLLYGVSYSTAGSILRILLCGWTFRVMFIPFSFLFVAFGDTRTRFMLEAWKSLVGLSLLYWLVPLQGLYGAAYAMSLTYTIEAATSAMVLKYKLGHGYRTIGAPRPIVEANT
ncbi:MAG: oligosaccharide flippase family protein [Deltaproteobacteria bacterium]|nr:oligosaccharide flippase family protein [Deltaproteobacteria bacterium]